MTETPLVRVRIRQYELDINGHLGGSVYVQYADHARWECLREAGVDLQALMDSGMSPVNLETTLRFHREVRGGMEIDIASDFWYGPRKTGGVNQRFLDSSGELLAEVSSVSGLLDLATRRLVTDPGRYWREFAHAPEVLGLA